MKVQSASLTSLSHIGKHILAHDRLIAFMLMMITLIYCVMTIQEVLDLPSDDTYRTEQIQKNTKTQFDKKTVDQIKQLRTTTDAPITLPPEPINPFIE
ncbi:MAG: hypothetical protein WAU02_00990 [Candidatus Saccharimonadales bacterium]